MKKIILPVLIFMVIMELVMNHPFHDLNLSKNDSIRDSVSYHKRLAYSIPDSIAKKISTGGYSEGPDDYYVIAVDSKMNVAVSTGGETDILYLDSTGRLLAIYSFDTIPLFGLENIGFDESDSILIAYGAPTWKWDYVSDEPIFTDSFILKGKNGHFKRYPNDSPRAFYALEYPSYGFDRSWVAIPAFHTDKLISDRPEKFDKVYNCYFSPSDSSIYFVWVRSLAHWKDGEVLTVYNASNAHFVNTKLLYVNRSETIAYYSNHGDLFADSLGSGKESKRILCYGCNYGIYKFAFCQSTKTIVGVNAENKGNVEIDFIKVDE